MAVLRNGVHMMRMFERKVFRSFYDRDSGRTFANLEFHQCRFEASSISITNDPRLRSTVRNVHLIQCAESASPLWGAIVEDVVVDGLTTSDLFRTWGAVFKHVTLKGKIGPVMISPALPHGSASIAQRQAFDAANAAYYATVEWALDISQAEFERMDIRGIPARLIRRDPATQVVVTRAKALEGDWRRLDLSQAYWLRAIQCFLDDSQDPDVVLVAPKRHREYRHLLAGLQVLRDGGIAEPD